MFVSLFFLYEMYGGGYHSFKGTSASQKMSLEQNQSISLTFLILLFLIQPWSLMWRSVKERLYPLIINKMNKRTHTSSRLLRDVSSILSSVSYDSRLCFTITPADDEQTSHFKWSIRLSNLRSPSIPHCTASYLFMFFFIKSCFIHPTMLPQYSGETRTASNDPKTLLLNQ